MKRIIIVVEGQTEQEFVKQCLAPYFSMNAGIHSVTARLIGKPGHKGGDVRFSRLKTDLEILLREPDTIVSSFIDLFKLGNDFPNSGVCLAYSTVEQRVNCLEEGLSKEIGSSLFLPYVQCHEFEALLFSSHKGFQKYFSSKACIELSKVSLAYPNPENINNTQPPSYRLISIFEKYENLGYKKVAYGNILALEVGVSDMIASCPRFANWIKKLIYRSTT